MQSTRELERRLANLVHDRLRQRMRRQRARGIARVNSGLFDVFHDAADQSRLAIGNGIDIDFDRVFQELVDQDRMAGRSVNGFFHVESQRLFVVANLHRATTEHVAGANQNWISDSLSDRSCAFKVRSGSVRWLQQTGLVEDRLKALPIFGRVDHVWASADDRNAGCFQRSSQIQWSLPAELHDHAVRLQTIANVEHVLGRQRFEKQDVRRVVVSRNRFRIRVDHDALDAEFLERERRLAAAIVELDALPDAVRTAAQNHDSLASLRRGLVFAFVRRIVVRRVSFKLGGARIDLLERRFDAAILAVLPDVAFVRVQPRRKLPIRKTGLLRSSQQFVGTFRQRTNRDQFFLDIDDASQLPQEPRIDAGHAIDIVQRHTRLHRKANVEDPFVIRDREFRNDFVFARLFLRAPQILGTATESKVADLQTANCFLERFFERAADRHRLADRLHLNAKRRVGFGEFLESPTRDLRHDIVDRRFEAGQSLARDIVADFVQPISDGQLGGDFRDRKTGRLRSQCAAATDSRIHFDNDHPPGFRIDRKLHVRAARLDTDLAHAGDRGVTHPLVFFVAQSLSGCDRDRIARVNSHRVEVLNRTNDDDVIGHVAHHFHLVLFPADDRFFQ